MSACGRTSFPRELSSRTLRDTGFLNSLQHLPLGWMCSTPPVTSHCPTDLFGALRRRAGGQLVSPALKFSAVAKRTEAAGKAKVGWTSSPSGKKGHCVPLVRHLWPTQQQQILQEPWSILCGLAVDGAALRATDPDYCIDITVQGEEWKEHQMQNISGYAQCYALLSLLHVPGLPLFIHQSTKALKLGIAVCEVSFIAEKSLTDAFKAHTS